MVIDLEKLRGLATMYVLLLFIGTCLFAIFIDYRALKKKKLNREAKICKFMGYACLISGVAFFIAARYVI